MHKIIGEKRSEKYYKAKPQKLLQIRVIRTNKTNEIQVQN
jgi:hypothetical protein